MRRSRSNVALAFLVSLLWCISAHAVSHPSSKTYTYDLDGNRATKSESGVTTSYHYDESDRLIRIERPSGNVIARYGYDPFGARLWKENGAGARSYYDYTDDGLAAEFSSTGTVQKTYLFAPDSYWSTAPLAMKQGSQYHYYHNDHLGTPRKLTNNVGAITWSARYSGYGIADVTESGANNPLRLPGQYADPESGLHHNYQRNYDPELGVYAEQDPYGVAWTGANRHLYANGEPGLGFDPTGEIVPAWVIWSGVTFLASEAYSGFPTFRCFQYLIDNCTYASNGEACIEAGVSALTSIGVGVAARGAALVRLRRLIRAGEKLDRNGLTKAARALQKHGDRLGSAFPKASGNLAKRNSKASDVLREILRSPNRVQRGNRYGGKDYFSSSSGRGARYDREGNFMGFLEP